MEVSIGRYPSKSSIFFNYCNVLFHCKPTIGIPHLWTPPALRILRMRRTVPPKEASLWGVGNPSIFMTRSVWTYDWELVHEKLPCSGCISRLQSCRESSLVLIYPGLMVENPLKIVFSGACRFRPFQVFMGENKALASNLQGSIMKQGENGCSF